jgi:NAD(P)-dependent dehydrogenase (short-subunit alcohol dehydrogenase family)
MTIRIGIATSILNLVVVTIICVVAVNFFLYKKLASVISKRTTKAADSRKKLVVVTGCDTGFGRLLAESLVSSTDLLVLALTLTQASADEFLEKEKKMVRKSDGNSIHQQLFAFPCNVTSDSDVAAMKSYAGKILQTEEAVLYAIVNNAGIANPGDFLWFPDTKAHQTTMDVNFFGMLRVTHALLPIMIANSTASLSPRILNLSSVCGTTASPSNSAYCASKFAVEAWSDSLRIELAPFHISVTKIRPGQVKTKIQSDYFVRLIQNYNSAPTEVRTLYGKEDYEQKLLDVKKITVDSDASQQRMSDPSLVVVGLQDILLLDSQIAASYWMGADAYTLWKSLYVMPSNVVEAVKTAMLHISPILNQ